ncbi:hypothetical protein [Niallia sp. NCCP-28]|uniref:hypothetical protein n=1 Tax=Niallia sp. NCCP-28 TaxID=2934712 RepID=UPI00208BC5A0|nr:hypothetical protein [Niallia sp. NCCP-28]GKU80971.1 hypothetical protein NCCP28_03670 [Niallia sp. NCCP-28]
MKEEYNKAELLKMLETIYDDLEELDSLLLGVHSNQKKELEDHLDHLELLEAAFSVFEQKLKKETTHTIAKSPEKIRRMATFKLELS